MNQALIDGIKLEAAGRGDVVFITVPANTPPSLAQRIAAELKQVAEADRAAGKHFPRCLILPAGYSATVAREPVEGEGSTTA